MYNGKNICCRFCFEGDEYENLISPCGCSGGQKYIHLSCLRQWQRMLIVSQPTNPSLWLEDIRFIRCNVCLKKYTCQRPNRYDMIKSFTGSRVAKKIRVGSFVGTLSKFSSMIGIQLQRDPIRGRMMGLDHWINAAYLIVDVRKESRRKIVNNIKIQDERELVSMLRTMRELDDNGQVVLYPEGVSDFNFLYMMSRQGVLANVTKLKDIYQALLQANLPTSVQVSSLPWVVDGRQERDQGHDTIVGLNLTKRLESMPTQYLSTFVDELRVAFAKCPEAQDVTLQHYNAGPCDRTSISKCIVFGGIRRGWTLHDSLAEAIVCAYERFHEGPGHIGQGQRVRLKDLKSREDLNGLEGVTLRHENGRWVVRLFDGRGVRLQPKNLDTLQNVQTKPRVLVCWGCAKWSRSQLLGEVARGHWGLATASVGDLWTQSTKLCERLNGRLLCSPQTAMTDPVLRSEENSNSDLRTIHVTRSHGERSASRSVVTESDNATSTAITTSTDATLDERAPPAENRTTANSRKRSREVRVTSEGEGQSTSDAPLSVDDRSTRQRIE